MMCMSSIKRVCAVRGSQNEKATGSQFLDRLCDPKFSCVKGSFSHKFFRGFGADMLKDIHRRDQIERAIIKWQRIVAHSKHAPSCLGAQVLTPNWRHVGDFKSVSIVPQL